MRCPRRLHKPQLHGELAEIDDRRYNTRMNATLKITKIGNSAGIILPKEVLARLRADVGDALFLTEAPDGVRLSANNPDLAAKMEAAEAIMREDRDILRVLAQ